VSVWKRILLGTWLVLTTDAGAQTSPTVPSVPSAEGATPGLTVEGLSNLGALSTAPRAESPGQAISGPIDPDNYRVGPGDVLQLQLWGRVSRSWQLTVGPEGTVIVPGSGTVQVSGRTLTDVRAEVLASVRSQFHGVSMDMRLSRPRQFIVYLTGQVRSPGPTTATGSQRVGDLINASSVQENPSMRHIEVRHTDGTRQIADLDLFLRTGVTTMNPWLRDGDILYVPVATDFIYASGALARPGRFELGPEDSLLTLFRLAGDPIPAADVSRVLLLRWKDPFNADTLSVRLDDVYSRKINPPLREGDRAYVYYLPQYHLQHEAFVTGEVARPGSFPITEGRNHLSDLIQWAGGFLPTADLATIRVHRRSPGANDRDQELERLLRLSRDQMSNSEYQSLRTKLAGLREDYSIEWNRLKESPGELDLLLRDGDLVRVERLVNSIRIDGEVRHPGILSFRPGLGVDDYIRQAGGFTSRAWTRHVRVTRSVTGQVIPAQNISALDPGDFVWVPEKPDRTAWDHFSAFLTAMAQLATVVIAVKAI